MFVKFVEYNDHEGETWTYWLELTENLNAIAALDVLLKDSDVEEQYCVDWSIIDEHDVNVLTRFGGQGYSAFHQKVKGTFVIPENFEVDDLYKGGIHQMFS